MPYAFAISRLIAREQLSRGCRSGTRCFAITPSCHSGLRVLLWTVALVTITRAGQKHRREHEHCAGYGEHHARTIAKTSFGVGVRSRDPQSILRSCSRRV